VGDWLQWLLVAIMSLLTYSVLMLCFQHARTDPSPRQLVWVLASYQARIVKSVSCVGLAALHYEQNFTAFFFNYLQPEQSWAGWACCLHLHRYLGMRPHINVACCQPNCILAMAWTRGPRYRILTIVDAAFMWHLLEMPHHFCS
jgi:hypothetical protein